MNIIVDHIEWSGIKDAILSIGKVDNVIKNKKELFLSKIFLTCIKIANKKQKKGNKYESLAVVWLSPKIDIKEVLKIWFNGGWWTPSLIINLKIKDSKSIKKRK